MAKASSQKFIARNREVNAKGLAQLGEGFTRLGLEYIPSHGNFITVLINFLILAFIIFVMVKQINRLRRSHAEAKEAAPPPEDVLLLREIRDSLRR